MATENAFPALSAVQDRITAGERRLYQQLQKKLRPDEWFWYDQPMKQRGAWADFVILSPEHGILLLEVKDWTAETILAANPERFEIKTPQGPKSVANPRQQAWRNLLALVDRLQRDPALVQASGSYRGKLAFNYAHGVVFPNLTRKRFEALGLDGIIPSEQVLCSDEMTDSVPEETFRARLWGMCDYRMARPLTEKMVARVRWHLFPEVRVGQQAQLFDGVEALPLDEQIRLLDREQERLARSLGDGHRVIHGVSGSGKTLVLMTRARLLAQMGAGRVGLICFNRTLAKVLRDRLGGDSSGVEVLHYHAWARQRLQELGVKPESDFRQWPQQLLQAQKKAPPAYAAMHIDEGHDLEPDWVRTLVQATEHAGDPRRQKILFAYDDAQNIYHGSRRGLGWALSDVGIQAKGRTTILRRNYRNSSEITRFSFRFLQAILEEAGLEDVIEGLVPPEPSEYVGPAPQQSVSASLSSRAEALADWLEGLHAEQGIPWDRMAVIYMQRCDAGPVIQAFKERGLPWYLVGSASAKSGFDENDGRIKLITAHSAKGLEFDAVAVIGAEHLTDGQPEEETVREGKQLYVAMTRAKKWLHVFLLDQAQEEQDSRDEDLAPF